MRTLLAALTLLSAFAPVASAVVNVRVERVTPLPGEIVWLEVFLENPDPAESERLNAYTIALNAPRFGAPGGNAPYFVVPENGVFPEPTAHPYVFGAYPGNPPTDPAQLSDSRQVFLSAGLGGAGQEVNITDTLNGIAKVGVFIPATMPPGLYPIVIDPTFLSLGSAGAPIVAVPLGGGGIDFIPEPASPALVVLGGALALGRRRRAA